MDEEEGGEGCTDKRAGVREGGTDGRIDMLRGGRGVECKEKRERRGRDELKGESGGDKRETFRLGSGGGRKDRVGRVMKGEGEIVGGQIMRMACVSHQSY